jgi:hypothetical protein
MALPLDVAAAEVELDYYRYNVHPSRPYHGETGTRRVDSVTHSA